MTISSISLYEMAPASFKIHKMNYVRYNQEIERRRRDDDR